MQSKMSDQRSPKNRNKNFIKELKERSRSVADGSAKTYTLEETKRTAIERVESSKIK